MVSIKVKFRASAIPGSKGTLFYQIIYRRKVRHITTALRIYPSEWSSRLSMPAVTAESPRYNDIARIRTEVRHDIARINRIIRRLSDEEINFDIDHIIDSYQQLIHDISITNFMESLIANMKINGRIRTSETYRTTLYSFTTFLGGDILIDCVTAEMIEAYQNHLQCRGLLPNSTSFYMRILRAVFNRAIDRGMIPDTNRVRHVYTGVDKTVKRALPLNIIRRIHLLDLSANPTLDYARDMFMLSFILRGMSFIDMAFLRKSNLKNGHITYRRHKTGQMLSIACTKEMEKIIRKYPVPPADYLLPIMRRQVANERTAYRNISYTINRSLKKIAEMIGLDTHLTLYVARHSWASAAKAKGIPLSVISEGMGHDSELTTRIYLATLDTTAVDRANALILKSI